MDEAVICPNCERRLQLPSDYLGGDVQCPQCSSVFQGKMGTLVRSAPSQREEPDLVTADLPTNKTVAVLTPNDQDPPTIAKRLSRRAPTSLPVDMPAKSTSRARVVMVVLVAGLAFLACLAWYGMRSDLKKFDDRMPFGRNPMAAGNPQTLLAVNDDPPKVQMAEFFVRFARAVRDNNRADLAFFFDGSSMVDRAIAEGGLIGLKGEERIRFIEELNLILADAFLLGADSIEFYGAPAKIRIIGQANPGWKVTVSHHPPSKRYARHRWTIADRGGFWRIVDHENVDFGLPLSDVTIAGFRQAGKVQNQDVIDLNAATVSLGQPPNLVEAERLLKRVRVANLPGTIAGSYHQTQALLHLHCQRHQECLTSCDEAGRLKPDQFNVEMLRAIVKNTLKKHDEALVHAKKSHERIGDDADVFHEIGLALHETHKFREAAVYYRKALDEEPNSPQTLLNLLRCVGPDVDHHDLGARFANLGRPRDHFGELARDAWTHFNSSSLEQLSEVMRKLEPRDPEAAYYLALAHADQRHFAQAMPSFRSALELQPLAERRRDYYREFAKVLTSRDHAAAAYVEFPDAMLAFEALSTALRLAFKFDDLDDLIALHSEKHPNDPQVKLNRADALVREEKFAEANQIYSAAFAKGDDPNRLEAHRNSFTLARYRTGDIMVAYRDIAPRHATFDQLAALCWQDKKADVLKALVAAHRKNDDRDPKLVRQEWRIALLEGRVESAGKVVATAAKEIKQDDQRRILIDDFLFDALHSDRILEAFRCVPDRAFAFEMVMQELLDANRLADAKAILNERRTEDPKELLLEVFEGELAQISGDWSTAAKRFRSAWPLLPEDRKPRWSYSCLFTSYKAGQGFEAYQELRAHRDAFRVLAGIISQDKNRTAFEKLIALRRSEKPNDAEFVAYEARIKVLEGNIDEAKVLFDGAWKKTMEFERMRLVGDFVADLAQLGRGFDAYLCVPDKARAFQQLAWRLRGPKNVAEMERLIHQHAQSVGDDPGLLLERAELHLTKNELVQAEKLFLMATAKPAAPEFFSAKAGLMRTRLRQGKGPETYHELGANLATFRDLANQCLIEKNAVQMQAVLDAHRKAFPNARNLAAFEVEILWLRKDYPATAQRILAERASLLGNSLHRWKCESYLIRSLVRSKKPMEALKEAQTMNKLKYGPEVLLVLAIAAKGDVQGAITQIEKGNGQRYLIQSCFQDEDLGPILRSDAFRDFRKRFPEPPKNADNLPD